MGRRRKRLIVQADLTSEEDQGFLAWVEGKLKRRRLAEEIRLGLRLRYEASTGQVPLAYPSYPRVEQWRQVGEVDERQEATASSASNRLQKLVQSF